MKESYSERVATHTGPELCAAGRKAGDEALVGVRAGRVLSPESNGNWGADAVGISGKPHPVLRQRKMGRGPHGVGDLAHARKHFAREPGDPRFPRPPGRRRGAAGSLYARWRLFRSRVRVPGIAAITADAPGRTGSGGQH